MSGRGQYTEVRTNGKDKDSRGLYCIIGGIVVSVVLLAGEIWCLTYVISTINNLRSEDISYSPPEYNRYRTPHALISCNKSEPCYMVEDETYATLVKILSGVKTQTKIRQENKVTHSYLARSTCEQFTLSECADDSLKWVGSFYGNRGVSSGNITIDVKATYGLYSLFTFKHLDDNAENITDVFHRIHVEKSTTDSAVMFERRVVLNPNQGAFQTSLFFEFVSFDIGDHVYPSLSDTSSLYSVKEANMWGVFRVM
ncbi:uncharacterized protein LOC132564020 [Ylistrum balloti]|uniref:uncharacterized protein LOC132564020 n=1 Tax=Ylistrum balloti TaxID=509963 RepID=UPI002905DB68|nr:uncharacterized protein LOC132564020 [Ylistrum balloti]